MIAEKRRFTVWRREAPTLWVSAWAVAAMLSACGGDDTPAASETGTDATSTSTSSSTSSTGSTLGSTSDASVDLSSTTTTTSEESSTGSTTAAPTTGSSDAGTTEYGSSSGTTGDSVPMNPFSFRNEDPSEFTQVDRVGMPGKATLVVTDHEHDNAQTPLSDITDFVGQEGLNVTLDRIMAGTGLAGNGIVDDLNGLGFITCETISMPQQAYHDSLRCGKQFLFDAVPDVLPLWLDDPIGYPNGRRLEDPVMDLVLAKMWLNIYDEIFWGVPYPDDPDDAEQDAHGFDAFLDIGEGVSLNPPENDVPFDDSRYFRLADPHGS